MFPAFSIDINSRIKKYRANFSFFKYEIEVTVGKGFGLELSLGEFDNLSYKINQADFIKRLNECGFWKKRIINDKINVTQLPVRYVSLNRFNGYQVCAVIEDTPVTFRSIEEKTAGRISKYFEVLNSGSSDLYGERKDRDRVKIVELAKWKCLEEWERIDRLIKACVYDIERWKDYRAAEMTDRELGKLAKNCIQLKLRHNVFKDHRGRGITIQGHDFKYFNAAQQIIQAVDSELKYVPRPSYDMIKG